MEVQEINEEDEQQSETTPAETSEKPTETQPEAASEPVREPTPEPPKPPKPQVNIVLKTPKEKQTVSIDEDAIIEDIKKIAAEKFSADPEYLCLIFAGKLMEDTDTLDTHNIKDGMTIHLIIKTAPKEPEKGPLRPPADISQTPYGFGAVGKFGDHSMSTDDLLFFLLVFEFHIFFPGGLAGLESLGMGSANFMELQNRLQTELISNPELLKRVLENPLVNSLMADVDNMKTLIVNNPQMQDLIQRHPEIKYMLNNPELLKQTAELAKNPSMLQELMRAADGNNEEEMDTPCATLPSVYNAFQGKDTYKLVP